MMFFFCRADQIADEDSDAEDGGLDEERTGGQDG